MNIKEALIDATSKLQLVAINSASLESRILLQYATGKSIEYLLARFEQELPELEQITFTKLVSRRMVLEPIAYIIGSKEFYGYEFLVDDNVLIPRQDTEILIDAVLNNCTQKEELQILELGIGSGCIAISLLLKMSNAYLTATDISDKAINMARQNALKHQVSGRLKIINSDWFTNLEPQKFDIIISNPPYISYDDTANMSIETLKYEPNLALFADDNGLAFYYIIAQEANNFLKPNGKLFVEIGFNQSDLVGKIFTNYGYNIERIYKDLAGHDRAILFKMSNLL